MTIAAGPLSRMTPSAPAPGGVAMATMVSAPVVCAPCRRSGAAGFLCLARAAPRGRTVHVPLLQDL